LSNGFAVGLNPADPPKPAPPNAGAGGLLGAANPPKPGAGGGVEAGMLGANAAVSAGLAPNDGAAASPNVGASSFLSKGFPRTDPPPKRGAV
jgi:hypothetical protein